MARVHRRAPTGAPQGCADRETLANQRLEELEPKLARVELAIPRTVAATVRVDLDGGGIATLGAGILVTLAGVETSHSENPSSASEGQAVIGLGVVMDLVGATLLVVGMTSKAERRVPYQARAGGAAFTF